MTPPAGRADSAANASTSPADGTTEGVVPLDYRYLHVMLDVVEKCNLRCTHCPFVWWRDEVLAGLTMSDQLIEKLEKELFPFTMRATLSTFHEPLMAPEALFKAVAAAKRAGVQRIDFTTNAILFTESNARRVLEGGISMINFSVDGASPKTYESVRLGGQFDRFENRLALISRTREELGLRKAVEFRFTACMMRSNLHEATKIVELAAKHGVDAVELRYTMKVDVTPLAEFELVYHSPEECDRAYAAAIARGRELGVRVETPPSFDEILTQKRPRPKVTNCMYPWYTIVVTPSGGILPCCMWHGSKPLDTIGSRDMPSVWNGETYRALRKEFETGNLTHKECQNCIVHFDKADPRYWAAYEFTR